MKGKLILVSMIAAIVFIAVESKAICSVVDDDVGMYQVISEQTEHLVINSVTFGLMYVYTDYDFWLDESRYYAVVEPVNLEGHLNKEKKQHNSCHTIRDKL